MKKILTILFMLLMLVACGNKQLVMPVKGDVITLNDGVKYRVLNVDDTKVQVFAIDIIKTNQRYWKKGNQTVTFTSIDGKSTIEGTKYEGSDLDKYLNGDTEGCYYYSLPIEMKNAIVDQEISQNIYSFIDEKYTSGDYVGKGTYGWHSTDFYITGGYKPVSVGMRHVFALDVQDIVDYQGKDNLTIQKNKEMIFDGKRSNKYIWLRSACSDHVDYGWAVDDGTEWPWIYMRSIDGRFLACPSFVIDLSTKGVKFEIRKEEKAK